MFSRLSCCVIISSTRLSMLLNAIQTSVINVTIAFSVEIYMMLLCSIIKCNNISWTLCILADVEHSLGLLHRSGERAKTCMEKKPSLHSTNKFLHESSDCIKIQASMCLNMCSCNFEVLHICYTIDLLSLLIIFLYSIY